MIYMRHDFVLLIIIIQTFQIFSPFLNYCYHGLFELNLTICLIHFFLNYQKQIYSQNKFEIKFIILYKFLNKMNIRIWLKKSTISTITCICSQWVVLVWELAGLTFAMRDFYSTLISTSYSVFLWMRHCFRVIIHCFKVICHRIPTNWDFHFLEI